MRGKSNFYKHLMILDELLMTVFDEGAPDNEDDLMTVRFSDTQIDRLYSQGCKHNEMLPYQINAWQEKIKDVFLFYVAETSYSVFDVCYHFSDSGVRRCFFIRSPMSMRMTGCVREIMCCPVIKSFRR